MFGTSAAGGLAMPLLEFLWTSFTNFLSLIQLSKALFSMLDE